MHTPFSSLFNNGVYLSTFSILELVQRIVVPTIFIIPGPSRRCLFFEVLKIANSFPPRVPVMTEKGSLTNVILIIVIVRNPIPSYNDGSYLRYMYET